MLRKALFLLLLVVSARALHAQSHVSVGLDADWSRALAVGRYVFCGCGEFNEGKGVGGSAAFVFSIPFRSDLDFNIAAGYSVYSASYSRLISDTAALESVDERDTVMTFPVRNQGEWTAKFLTVTPSVEYHVTEGLRIIAGPEVAVYLGGNERLAHELPDTTAIKFKSTGTASEVLVDRPISDTRKLSLALRVGVGYEFSFGSFKAMPEAEVSYGLTPIFSDPNHNVNITRFAAGIRFLYEL